VRRLWTPRWVLVHIAVVVLVLAFLRLGWWQVTRAADGNLLSYGYALQWPAFAVFVVFVWIKEMRRPSRTAGDATPRAVNRPEPRPAVHTGPAYEDDGDDQLAAYNRYLAWLNAHPEASPRDYPG
jgi:DNA-binding transcriptional regulator of glucitol operon